MEINGVRINTIQELVNLYYGRTGVGLIQKGQFFNKDAPVLSTTTGVYNPVYGAQVWTQLNLEANAFGLSPKTPWDHSGWRVETARPASSGGGVGENGSLPATIKPTWKELSCKPKTVAHTFDVSEVQEFLASNGGDDAIANMAMLRARMGLHHKEMMNVMLLTDVDTLAGNNLESIDRVCSSKSEEDNCGITAGDADIYSIDRSDASNSWADAQVDHNSNVDRTLTDDILRDMIVDTIPTAGGNTTFGLTGADTMSAIISLYQTQVRYGKASAVGQAERQITLNGVQTAKGIDVGLKVTTVYNIPFFTSKNVVKDTLSRIYLLDTSDPEGYGKPRLGIDVAAPTQYFEAGMNMGTPFAIDQLGNEGMYRTMAELKCRFFAAQGKIRDLKAS